jgi:hypothetical protein
VEPHDLQRTLRRLEPGGWLAAARRFAASLRGAGHEPGRLLVVGTPEDEPWHLAAHLSDTARWRDIPALHPVLVRREVLPGAPPHLSVGLDAVHRAGTGSTVLVAAPSPVDDALLERLQDARRGGATLLALHPRAAALDELAHESLALPAGLMTATEGFDAASHIVSAGAAGDLRPRRTTWLRAAGRAS